MSNTQDRLDTIKALYYLNSAIVNMVAAFPPELQSNMKEAVDQTAKVQEVLTGLMTRFDKDLSNGS